MDHILKKLFTLSLTIILVSLMIFMVFQILPGNPARAILGIEADESQVKYLEKEMGLDKSLPERYFKWLGGTLKGDLGKSLKYNIPVVEIIKDRAKITLLLTLYSMLLTILIGIPLGIWIALREGKWYSSFTMILTQIGISVPTFWIGYILVYIFAYKLGWFPTIGRNVLSGGIFKILYVLFMPSLAIAISNVAILVRYLRNTILDQVRKDYVRTAIVKGNSVRGVIYKHILRNAIIPVITILGLLMAYSIGGSIIIENVFALPGLGTLIVQSITSRDFPLIQSVILFISIMTILLNFCIDIIYNLIDPRMGIGE